MTYISAPPPETLVTVADTGQQGQRVTTSEAYLLVYASQGGAPYIMSRRDLAAPSVLDRQRFQMLANQWREETFLSSSLTDNLTHPAYLKILAMGEKALSLILTELQERGGHWFMALNYITDENPVHARDQYKTKKMREAWIEWGRQHGYL